MDTEKWNKKEFDLSKEFCCGSLGVGVVVVVVAGDHQKRECVNRQPGNTSEAAHTTQSCKIRNTKNCIGCSGKLFRSSVIASAGGTVWKDGKTHSKTGGQATKDRAAK